MFTGSVLKDTKAPHARPEIVSFVSLSRFEPRRLDAKLASPGKLGKRFLKDAGTGGGRFGAMVVAMRGNSEAR